MTSLHAMGYRLSRRLTRKTMTTVKALLIVYLLLASISLGHANPDISEQIDREAPAFVGAKQALVAIVTYSLLVEAFVVLTFLRLFGAGWKRNLAGVAGIQCVSFCLFLTAQRLVLGGSGTGAGLPIRFGNNATLGALEAGVVLLEAGLYILCLKGRRLAVSPARCLMASFIGNAASFAVGSLLSKLAAL